VEISKNNELTNKLQEVNNLLKLSEHVKDEQANKNQDIQLEIIALKGKSINLSK
jgi:hypothetical protein